MIECPRCCASNSEEYLKVETATETKKYSRSLRGVQWLFDEELFGLASYICMECGKTFDVAIAESDRERANEPR